MQHREAGEMVQLPGPSLYTRGTCSPQRPRTLAHHRPTDDPSAHYRSADLGRLLGKLVQRPQLLVLALVLILGMGFRCYGLDHKVYWHDEVFTSLRAAGHIGEEVSSQLLQQSSGPPVGQAATAADLQQFQRLSPDKTWADTWASLQTHPEHPPLFYLLERGWMGLMGSSIAATRGLSALFSIALFPLLAWFCNDLGQWQSRSQRQSRALSSVEDQSRSPRWATGRQTAAVAIALLAISPVQVLYAQEAREYSLWAWEIVLASGLLLRAVRQPQSWRLWLGYGGAIALGLYTTLLTGLVIVAHSLFLLGQKTISLGMRWLSAIVLATLLFSPWLLVTARASQKLNSVTAWTKIALPLGSLSKLWGLHLAASFIDLGFPLAHPYSVIAPAAALLIVGLSWLAIPQGPVRWFLLTMLAVPALLLVLPDLIQGGQRSSVTRYFMPLVLMALVTVALGIATGLRSARRTSRLACQLLLAGLLTAGTVSCYRSAIAPAWWNKSFNFVMPAMAQYITQAQQPQATPVWIELGSNGLGNAIALSHRLPPETPFYFFKLPNLPAMSQTGSQQGLLIPYASGKIIEAVQQAYSRPVEPVEAPEVYELWELK